jgi:hypothetical protein
MLFGDMVAAAEPEVDVENMVWGSSRKAPDPTAASSEPVSEPSFQTALESPSQPEMSTTAEASPPPEAESTPAAATFETPPSRSAEEHAVPVSTTEAARPTSSTPRVLTHLHGNKPPPASGSLTADSLPTLLSSIAELPGLNALVISSPNSQRTVWLQGERIEAVQTRVAHESLLEQARRDGLIDERQASQLQPLRFAAPSDVLSALLDRGLVREKEAEPLLDGYVDGVVLAALCEPGASFELRRDEALPITGVVRTRPLPPILAEALRRWDPPPGIHGHLQIATLWPFDAHEHFGFTERERRLLRQLESERTVAALSDGSSKGVDGTARILGAWIRLGWIELNAPLAESPQAGPVSVARLSAKLAASEEADYFAVLGISRQADRAQVQEAFEQLAREFNPMQFGAHPDPGIRSRAQQLHALLEEAAQVLSDDRLRGEYARNLLD